LLRLSALAHRGAHALRDRLFRPGAATDVGLVLVALWLFTQLNPETLLFGNGDLRGFFDAAEAELYAPETFVRIEAAVAGLNVLALVLLVAVLADAGQPVRLLAAAVIALAGLALMTATALVNLAPENPYHAHSLALWPQGHFLNFNGLTRLVSALWPFAALAYLLGGATRERGANE